MPLTVICPTCQKQLSIPDSAVGLQGLCPLCQNIFTVSPPRSTRLEPPPQSLPSFPQTLAPLPPQQDSTAPWWTHPDITLNSGEFFPEPLPPLPALLSSPGLLPPPSPEPFVRTPQPASGLAFVVRLGLLFFSLLLLSGLIAGGIWYFTRQPTGTPEPAYFFASDSHYLLEVDVATLRSSRWYANLKAKEAGLEPFQESAFRRATGVELADVKHLHLAGRFDNERQTILVLQTTKPVELHDVLGERYEHVNDIRVGRFVLYDHQGESVLLASPHLLVLGPTNALTEALKRKRPAPFPNAFQEAWKELPTDASVRLVLDSSQLLRQNGGEAVLGFPLLSEIAALKRVAYVGVHLQVAGELEAIVNLHVEHPEALIALRPDLVSASQRLQRTLGLTADEAEFFGRIQMAATPSPPIFKVRLKADAGLLAAPLKKWQRSHPDFWLHRLEGNLEQLAEAEKYLIGQSKQITPRLLSELNTRGLNSRRRERIIALLGKMGAEGAVGPLASLLREPGQNPALRLQATRALVQIIGKAQSKEGTPLAPKSREVALPVLLGLLADLHEETRLAARQALDRLVPFERTEVHVFEESVRKLSEDVRVRRYAFERYCEVMPPSAKVLSFYQISLKDSDRQIRLQCVRVLGKCDPQVLPEVWPALLERVADRDVEVANAVRSTLTVLPTPPEAGHALGQQLANLQVPSRQRLFCAEVLKRLGKTSPRSAYQYLIPGLADPEPEVRIVVLATLRELGEPAAEERLRLLEYLRRETIGPESLAFIAQTLTTKAGEQRTEVVRTLLKQLERPDQEVRNSALIALQKLGPFSGQDAALLKPLLRRASAPVDLRVLAIRGLGEAGTSEPEDLELLRSVLQEKVQRIRLEALVALRTVKTRDPKVVADVSALLNAVDPKERAAVLETLMVLQTEGKLVPLLRGLEDENTEVRALAEKALKAIKPTKQDLGALRSALKEGSETVRVYAARSLAGLGKTALPALPELRQGLRDSNSEIRLSSLQGIASLGEDGRPAVPELEEALKAVEQSTKQYAAVCLVALGEGKAIQTMPLLFQGMAGKDERLGEFARQSLRKLPVSYKDAAGSVAEAFRANPADPDVRAAIVNLDAAMLPYLERFLSIAPRIFNEELCLATLELLSDTKARSQNLRQAVLEIQAKGQNPKLIKAAMTAWEFIK